MKRAAFLDRDGVLNKTLLESGVPIPPREISEVHILSGVIEAIQLINDHDFLPVVITNQPDIGRGISLASDVDNVNALIASKTGIQHFYVCPHDDSEECKCRKPKPGLIQEAAIDLDIDVKSSFLVGDRWKDIASGQAVGLESYFIDYSYPEKAPNPPFTRVFSLLEAVTLFFEKEKNGKNE
jgi:D-glycero-D-manno-heptose 1,7-bisphosphate phosphatase